MTALHTSAAPSVGLREANRTAPRILSFECGTLEADELAAHARGGFGILILDGLIMAELEAGRTKAGWLIGAEDLVRPDHMEHISLLEPARWRVLKPARLLRLDGSLQPRLSHDPAVLQELFARAARTSHWLLAKSLIVSCNSIQERLVMLFGLWAERWGKVTPGGIRIELPLTHAMIAQLCGAQRPTVTVALSSLEKQGVLERPTRSAWLLRRHPDPDPSWWSDGLAGSRAGVA